MRLRTLGLAAAVVSLPFVASATTVNTVGNQTSIFFTNTDSNQNIGDFDLSTEPVGVTALFAEQNVTGSLRFGVLSPALLPARGSVDVNVIADNETFSGTFDGDPLNFKSMEGDFIASFGTSFADGSDVAEFVLSFSGFDPGDQFQANVAAIPLPASVLMLLGALGGLAFLGRRRR